MEKNGTFLLKNGKERNVLNGKERGAQPCTMVYMCLVCLFPFYVKLSTYRPLS